jgi:hypothetical protein
MDINKKYIILLLDHIKKLHPQQPNKIIIHDEIITNAPKEAITYEEIHNDRKNQFDKDLNNRQEEFMNAMSLKVPPVPDFTDKMQEEPIMEMDKIIKEMIMQRNYEIEVINKDLSNSNSVNMLQSQETSIKSEKKTFTNLEINTEKENNNLLHNKKNVSWGYKETREYKENDKIMEDTIFNKLKKINNNNNNNNSGVITNETMELNNINENKINSLENQIKILNEKVNIILNILQS